MNFHHRAWGLVPKASFWLQIESKRLGADGRQQAANRSKRCCGGLSFSRLFSAVVGKNFFHFFSFFLFMAIQSNPWKMTQLLLACYVLPVRLEDWTNMFTSASCWTNSCKIVTWCTTLLAGNYTKYLKFKNNLYLFPDSGTRVVPFGPELELVLINDLLVV